RAVRHLLADDVVVADAHRAVIGVDDGHRLRRRVECRLLKLELLLGETARGELLSRAERLLPGSGGVGRTATGGGRRGGSSGRGCRGAQLAELLELLEPAEDVIEHLLLRVGRVADFGAELEATGLLRRRGCRAERDRRKTGEEDVADRHGRLSLGFRCGALAQTMAGASARSC